MALTISGLSKIYPNGVKVHKSSNAQGIPYHCRGALRF